MPKNGPRKNESAIINLDLTTGPGTHWVAYKKENNEVQYFDSFGNLKPPPELSKYLNKKGNCNIFYNHERYQKYNSFNCGHLCLKFLYNI